MSPLLQTWIRAQRLSVQDERTYDDLSLLRIRGLDKGWCVELTGVEGKIIGIDFELLLTEHQIEALERLRRGGGVDPSDDESGDVRYAVWAFGGEWYWSELETVRTRYGEDAYRAVFNDLRLIGHTTEPQTVDFVPLGIHTEYEIMNGSGTPSLWARAAAFHGMRGAGIADRNTLAGVMEWTGACVKNGVTPIVGETVAVAVDYDPVRTVQTTYDVKVYAVCDEGWRNLLGINKEINVDYGGCIPIEHLPAYGAGIILVLGDDSPVASAMLGGRVAEVRGAVDAWKRAFDVVYFQIDTVEWADEGAFRRHLQLLNVYLSAYTAVLPPLVVNDAYCVFSDAGELRGVMNRLAGRAVLSAVGGQPLKTVSDVLGAYGEWLDRVPPLQEALVQGMLNTGAVCDAVGAWRIPTGHRHLPRFPVEDVEGLFRGEVEAGFRRRCGAFPPEEQERYRAQLDKETAVIIPAGLCDYFMILWDVLKWCRDNGIMHGPGRGSVCGSLVAYCLGITDVDPLRYGLMFERFLNETRLSGERAKSADAMPDVDVDVPAAYRDYVKEYVSTRYGEDYVCSIGMYTRMKIKTLIKDLGRLWGVPFAETNVITGDLPDIPGEQRWSDLIEWAVNSRRVFSFVQHHADMIRLLKWALGAPKAESVHPAGVVIVPRADAVTGQPSTLWTTLPVKRIDGALVAQWEGKWIDKGGFLKEDLLGLNQLDKFMNILRLIHAHTGKTIALEDIPLDDEEVFKYFRRGWNEDVFQFGTAGLMNYCRAVKPRSLDDLIAVTALFRPGPMDIGEHQDYSDIRAGTKKERYDYGMEEITRETHGLYVYQEQIMKAVVVGGLTDVESDTVRTAIKKKDTAAMNAYHDKFIAGYSALLADAEDVTNDPTRYAEDVWRSLLSFSGYSFNKSHAAAYSLIGYWGQWFKVHYPLEFWTTALHFSREAEIPYRLAELKKTGVDIEVRPPDVNISGRGFTCSPPEGDENGGGRIFFSLDKIKGVGEAAVAALLAVRAEGGRFFDLEEFTARATGRGVNKTVVKALILAGAFDLMEDIQCPSGRRALLERYLATRGETLGAEEYSGAAWAGDAPWIEEQRRLTGWGEVDYATAVRSAIPNKWVADHYMTDVEFIRAREGITATIAGRLIYYQEKKIKTGTMCTLNIECNNTIVPVVLWPDAYVRLPDAVDTLKGSTVVVCGKVKRDSYKNERKLYSDERTRVFVLNIGGRTVVTKKNIRNR